MPPPTGPQAIDPGRIREQLKKIEASELFRDVPRQRKFLQFIIEETLAGNAEQLTGSLIASELFKGSEDKLRPEAGRLRQRLTDYYQSVEGYLDPIKIEVPKGAYIPVFVLRSPVTTNRQTTDPEPTDRAAAMRASVFATYINAEIALKAKRFHDTIDIIDALFADLDESLLGREQIILISIRFYRFVALFGARRYSQLTEELMTIDLQQYFSGDMYLSGLTMALIAAESVGNVTFAARLRDELWKTAEEPHKRLAATKQIVKTADGLGEAKLFAAALTLLDGFKERIGQIQSASPELLAAFAATFERTIVSLSELDRHEEVLRLYYLMEHKFVGVEDKDALSELAWAGTLAARSLRALNRYADADMVADGLKDRFGTETAIRTRQAVAWATIECFWAYHKQKQFDAAVDRCVQFIEAQDKSGTQEPLIEAILVWAHARKAMCLRKATRYAEAVAECDFVIETYGAHTDVNIQQEVAYALIEKSIALRRAKRFAVSIMAAQTVIERFGSTTDPDIMSELVWARHGQGDTLLCEAKFLLQGGLVEDATIKLKKALEYFIEAANLEPKVAGHLGCKSYAEFLLGERSAAEQTFAKALSIGDSNWWNDYYNDWTEMRMFVLPEDDDFLKAVDYWRKHAIAELS